MARAHQVSADGYRTNQELADRFVETAQLLENERANPFRVRAYRQAADTLRRLNRPVEDVLSKQGIRGLDRLPGIGPRLAGAIREFVDTGRLPLRERLAKSRRPQVELQLVPGVGPVLARRLEEEAGIHTLEDLETAVYEGWLQRVPGIGPRRLEAIRLGVTAHLSRRPPAWPTSGAIREPPIGEVFEIDREYRELAEAHRLPTITPRRLNPRNEAWLPILHTRRGPRRTRRFSPIQREPTSSGGPGIGLWCTSMTTAREANTRS